MNPDLELLKAAAREAGVLALELRKAGLQSWSKDGGSPVTNADMASDALLTERLRGARPDYGWLSEETADTADRLAKSRIFVVDPIDGTAAFIKMRPYWTVALAVVEDGLPVAAAIYAPVLDEMFSAALGEGAFLNDEPIQASDTDDLEGATMLAPLKLFEQPFWPEPWPALNVERRESIAYRMCLVASGAFDAAVAVTPKWDWDVAAGALIAAEAGAVTTDHLGRPYRFNQPVPQQASLVCAAPALHPLIITRCAPIGLSA
jgi:myo-inositol-1(or 4)-monophosphatase